MKLADPFKDVLTNATNLGTQLLQREIADHGNTQPETRPAEAQIVTQPAEKPGMSKKTMLYVGGGVAAVVVLALILKKK